MCPPIEMFRFVKTNGRARLSRITGPRPDRQGSIPRARWKMNAARHQAEHGARRPDRERVRLIAIAPNEPASSEAK